MGRFKVGIFVCVAAALTISFVWNHAGGRYDPTIPYKDKIAYWKSRIQAVGGEPAYDELTEALTVTHKGLTHGMQHDETHIFASALYSVQGLKGISVCDGRFEYACFHQLVAEALSDRGAGSLNEIIEACKDGPGCKHSVGHGVLGLVGYTFPDLQEAVSICNTLPNEVYVQGCYGGIVMEYNMRTLLGDDHPLRSIGGDWFEPCSRLSKPVQRVCYFWQPTWWRGELSSSDSTLSPSALKRIGDTCRTVKDTDLKDSCIEGAGVSALNAARTTEDGVASCALLSPDTRDQALCRTSVARLVALLHGFDQGRSICQGLTGKYTEGCLFVLKNTSKEKSYLGEPLPFDI